MTGTRLYTDPNRDKVTIRPSAQLSTTRKIFARAAVTTGVVTALVGCGDTYIQNHNYGPDTADGGQTDGGSCAPGPKLVCGDAPIQEYVRKGQTLDVGNVHFNVEDLGVDGTGQFAVLSFQDPDCNTIKKVKVYVNQPEELSSVFGNYTVTLSATYTPDGGTQGVILKIEASCSETIDGCSTSGVAVAGIINQGEYLSIDSLRFVLDDVENQADGVYALFSVMDGNNTLTKLKIKEGNLAMVSINDQIYVVNVKHVAAGYRFGANWADIEVSICNP